MSHFYIKGIFVKNIQTVIIINKFNGIEVFYFSLYN